MYLTAPTVSRGQPLSPTDHPAAAHPTSRSDASHSSRPAIGSRTVCSPSARPRAQFLPGAPPLREETVLWRVPKVPTCYASSWAASSTRLCRRSDMSCRNRTQTRAARCCPFPGLVASTADRGPLTAAQDVRFPGNAVHRRRIQRNSPGRRPRRRGWRPLSPGTVAATGHPPKSKSDRCRSCPGPEDVK